MRKINLISGAIPTVIGIVMIFFISNNSVNAQCSMMKHGGSHSGHEKQNKDLGGDTTLIRKGVIDVYDIDFDKDGYVFQDQMHWNVISDEPADCPLCGMKLEKVNNKEAVQNLKDNGFEVKE